MLQSFLVAPGRQELREVPRPELVEPGTARIIHPRVGICGGDIDLYNGVDTDALPIAWGHEVFGELAEIHGPVTGWNVGDRVAVQSSPGYAREVVVPLSKCVRVPDRVREGALVESFGCAFNTLWATDSPAGETALILGGTGALGTYLHRLLRDRTDKLIVAGRREAGLARARNLGATRVVNLTTESIMAVVDEETDGLGVDTVFDCTGSQDWMLASWMLVKQAGKVVWVGYHQAPNDPQLDAQIRRLLLLPDDASIKLNGWRLVPVGSVNREGIKVINAHFRPEKQVVAGMAEAARTLADPEFDDRYLPSHVWNLDEMDKAMAYAASGKPDYVKGIIQC